MVRKSSVLKTESARPNHFYFSLGSSVRVYHAPERTPNADPEHLTLAASVWHREPLGRPAGRLTAIGYANAAALRLACQQYASWALIACTPRPMAWAPVLPVRILDELAG